MLTIGNNNHSGSEQYLNDLNAFIADLPRTKKRVNNPCKIIELFNFQTRRSAYMQGMLYLNDHSLPIKVSVMTDIADRWNQWVFFREAEAGINPVYSPTVPACDRSVFCPAGVYNYVMGK